MSLLRALGEKPWSENDATGATAAHPGGAVSAAPERVALRFFLGVVAVLFALFMTAYVVRMELQDWRPLPEPSLLWVNTLLLFLSSVALQWSRNALNRGDGLQLRIALLAGGVLTLAFVFGQVTVWRDMTRAGYLLYSNPANSFFYLLTGIHALHMLGGLWVWARATWRLGTGAAPEAQRMSVELCAVYWHFLFLVWLVLFALLSYT
ncbi:cytochrome c oxidase subunit 3 [Gilvimarinus sp. F26214L]|uniref:cytochrome c oxidase subunit 3 n=1 Tax=Gilvimarinus sp. DZF01 TaxID=3461371 RepID=UPI004045FC91